MISVVVPAYNAANTIGACLEALLAQSVPGSEYEVIVVNDGSTDCTGERIRPFVRRSGSEATVVRLFSQPNRGAAAAKNLGVRQARGDLILFTDADCVPAPNWIEAMRNAFAEPEIVGVKGICQSRQKSLVARFTQIEYEDKYDILGKHKFIDFIDTASAGYRKRVLLENGGFDTSLYSVEDVDLSFRLAQKGHKMAFSPHAIVYHKHPDTLLAYARRKYTYGHWRTHIYRRYPGKIVVDSRTPQTQKVQIGLFFLLGAAFIGSLFLPGLLLLATAFALLFLVFTLPFSIKAMKKDPWVGAISPLMLFVRAAAIGVGLGIGIVYQSLGRQNALVRS